MKKILLIVLCLWAFPVAASHIVGGEFEILYLFGNRYQINLILYFDKKNGSEGALDPNVNARIFRKLDNRKMMDVFLELKSNTRVNYTQPECSDGELETNRILYSGVVTLSAQQYSDAQGYYLSWERCCRNYAITNIYSEDPLSSSRYAGQTFYLEFPPVVKNGKPFINSSPRLFPPLNDFACPGRPYYVDFAGVDDDGDSLVYSIVTPLNTKSSDALPPPDLRPRPRPYPLVNYRPQFSPSNIMGGSPDLHISRDGFLRVTPRLLGLFVFAVKCEEFRNGEKIGEVRRDFQMLSIDVCAPAFAPTIVGKKLTDAAFGTGDVMNLSFSRDVADADRCIQVQVSDRDALRAADGFRENVTIRAVPLNFKNNVSGVLPDITHATLVNGSTATFDICFDKCPFIEDGPFQIGIVAYDDACSLPLSDTLKVTVTIQPPENTNAYFTSPHVTEVLFEGTSDEWPIAATDDDGDSLVISVITDGFNLADVGMEIRNVQRADGSYSATFHWDTKCDVYDFRTQTSFDVKVLVDDADECNYSHPDERIFNLTVILPGNEDPVISADLTDSEIEDGVSRQIFETLAFNVFGDDADNNPLDLFIQGLDFDFGPYGMTFPAATGTGHVTSPFNWQLMCDKVVLEDRDTFDLMFIVVDDANKCRIYQADTLHLQVRAEPPDNAAPLLTVASTNPDLPFIDLQQTLYVGGQISLGLSSADTDVSPVDHLVIEMVSAEGTVAPSGYIFEPGEGKGNAQTTFTWNTDCSIFVDGVYTNDYKFTFRTYDDRCQNIKADTVAVDFTIRDIENDIAGFLPPNFISADHDPERRNEFFAMVRLNESTGQLENIMPKDNCVGHFVGISIYNRWGKQIFESANRDFKWYPDEGASGIYFYTLVYSDKEFKGTITVRN